MEFSEKREVSGPEVTAFIGLLTAGMFVVAAGVGAFLELRKLKVAAQQKDDLRQLVHRYEHLAENTLDAQQRAATDVADLRSRTAAIEKVLRSVE